MTGTVTNRLDLADPATYDHGIPHDEFRRLRGEPGLV